MVLPAATALTMTTEAIIQTDDANLATEVSFAETNIRRAARYGVFSITYNAHIVGNPTIDPRIFTANLPPLQQQFYAAFVDVGYILGIDSLSGYWSITWSSTGTEVSVLVYSFRTSINPASIVDQTIVSMQLFFSELTPIVHIDVAYNGFINETDFGATTSTYYEFTIIAGQDSDRTDHSTNLKEFLLTQGLGYTSDNSAVYLLTP